MTSRQSLLFVSGMGSADAVLGLAQHLGDHDRDEELHYRARSVGATMLNATRATAEDSSLAA